MAGARPKDPEERRVTLPPLRLGTMDGCRAPSPSTHHAIPPTALPRPWPSAHSSSPPFPNHGLRTQLTTDRRMTTYIPTLYELRALQHFLYLVQDFIARTKDRISVLCLPL